MNKLKQNMNKMKQKWFKKSSQEKWLSLTKNNLAIYNIYLIIAAALLFMNKLEKSPKIIATFFVLFIFLALSFMLPYSYFSYGNKAINKKASIAKRIKNFIQLNCFFWVAYVIYLGIIPISLNWTGSFIIKQWPKQGSFLCFFYLAAALAIWIYQIIYCIFFLKECLLKKSVNILVTRIVHSMFISINGWLLILLNLFNFAELSRTLSIAYLIVSSSTILFYPSLDMFEYMSKEVYKFNRQKETEEIENESNGNKNYTV